MSVKVVSVVRKLCLIVAGIVLGILLLSPASASIILTESNMVGETGYKYWDIDQPGVYSISVTGQELYTNYNYGIRILSSNVYIDGCGLKITGPGVPADPYGNSGYGIHVYNNNCQNVTLKNFIIEKKNTGLYFEKTKNSVAEGISLNGNNCGLGIYLTENINVLDCQISQNSIGIHSNDAMGDSIEGCSFSTNNNGVYIISGENITILENIFTGNQNDGIWLDQTVETTITRNNITSTGYAGLFIDTNSNNNLIYDNYWENTNNLEIDSSVTANQLNIALTSGENIIGGSKIGGNYWNNPTDTGFSEMTLDVDGDGICDEHYVIKAGNTDEYALHRENTVKILDESNVQGSSGYQYWDITSPGSYVLGISSDTFYTNKNYAIRIASPNIVLDGNGKTITGPAPPSSDNENNPSNYGIRVNSGTACQNVTIKNFIIKKKYHGVIFEYVNGGGLDDTQVSENVNGIFAWKSTYLKILNNTATSNRNGIVLDSSDNNYCNYFRIEGNTFSSNTDFGILFWKSCNHNIVSNNTVSNNQNMGISLSDGGTNNTIDSNTVDGNPNGIYVYKYHNNNKITYNHLTGNTNDGIWIDNSNNNQYTGNRIVNTGYAGIYIGHSSSGNSIYNNYLKNTDNAATDGTSTSNQWSITPVTGPNIIGGPKIGGNFWTNPSGTGFSDITPDANGDGFCDSAFSKSGGIVDNYPLHAVNVPNADLVSNTIPGTMTGGQAYLVSVTMKNTGTMTWSEADEIRLGGVGDSGEDAAKFGPDRIKIAAGTTVAPGQEYAFSFTMTAPAAGGTYNPQYRMVWDGHQWFGQTLSTTVVVSGGGTVNAEVVSDTIPGTMTGGQSYSVSVTVKNIGTKSWSEADEIRLGGIGDSGGDAAKFGPDRIKIPAGTTVSPGGTYTFSFTMTAPTTGGTYNPQYRMVWDGHQWFGQTLSTTVVVSGGGTVNAEVVSNTIPGTMTGGQAYSVSVTMRNTGTMTWSEADSIRLGGVYDSSGDAAKFGPDRIKIPAGTTVAPGQTFTFSFTMTAPTACGTYTPQYRMVWDGHQWFGQTLSKTVVVPGTGTVNAEVVSNTIPGTMNKGQSYGVSVTMRNTGTRIWSEADEIRLGGVGDSGGDAAKFGPDRIKIPAGKSVSPGKTYTFSFTMTAPITAKTYYPKYQMVWDGHQWFGQMLSRTVVVQ